MIRKKIENLAEDKTTRHRAEIVRTALASFTLIIQMVVLTVQLVILMRTG